ncbi:type 4a pilus biogenesis protein PilO [Candidatus Microgenomates bacterium]|nr:type 4a pilus biogenesis protein PilO [Candidatus Microgenomates bacterium]
MQKSWRASYQRYLKLLSLTWQKRQDIRAYIGILLSLSAISFFGAFALRPTLITIGELVSQIKTQKETLAQLDQKVQNLQTASTNFNKVKSDLGLVDQAMPASPKPDAFLRQIEALAAQEGVAVQDTNIEKIILKGEQKSNPPTFKITFTTDGEYINTVSFLHKLVSLRRELTWDSLTLGAKAGADEGGRPISLTISGQLVFVP